MVTVYGIPATPENLNLRSKADPDKVDPTDDSVTCSLIIGFISVNKVPTNGDTRFGSLWGLFLIIIPAFEVRLLGS